MEHGELGGRVWGVEHGELGGGVWGRVECGELGGGVWGVEGEGGVETRVGSVGVESRGWAMARDIHRPH